MPQSQRSDPGVGVGLFPIDVSGGDVAFAEGACPRAVYVETGGYLKATGYDGVTFEVLVPDGYRLDVMVRAVFQTPARGAAAAGLFGVV